MNALFNPPVHIPVDDVVLEGALVIPPGARSIVVFAHGSGSSRHSPRNEYVAGVLNKAGIATLLVDLLSELEDEEYAARFDIPLLSRRLQVVTQWVTTEDETRNLGIGYFGASTGAAAAIKAAAILGTRIETVVCRGGRPDLAESELPLVTAPVLLIVGSLDDFVLELNRAAFARIRAPKHLHIVPRASHLFEEHGAIEEVAAVARDWFSEHMGMAMTHHLLAA